MVIMGENERREVEVRKKEGRDLFPFNWQTSDQKMFSPGESFGGDRLSAG